MVFHIVCIEILNSSHENESINAIPSLGTFLIEDNDNINLFSSV